MRHSGTPHYYVAVRVCIVAGGRHLQQGCQLSNAQSSPERGGYREFGARAGIAIPGEATAAALQHVTCTSNHRARQGG